MIGRNHGGGTGVVARMQTYARRPAALLMIFLVISLTGGCSGPPSPPVVPSPSVSPATSSIPPSGPLVTVETRGGMCIEGACGSTIAIEVDGRIHAIAPAPAELGTVPGRALDALITEIAQADFPALKSHPFTDTCPIAYDGQETIYTFTTTSAAQRIASCEVVVDPAAPLFLAVDAAMRTITSGG
jgi:hypothetical protein